jgi:hypothetical protein
MLNRSQRGERGLCHGDFSGRRLADSQRGVGFAMKSLGFLLSRCLSEVRFAVATSMRLVGMEAEGARFRGGRLLRKLSLMLGGRYGLIGGLRRLLLVTVLLRRVLLAGRLLIVSWRRRRQLAMILTSLSCHGWQAGWSREKGLGNGHGPFERATS